MESTQISAALRDFIGGFVRGGDFSDEENIFKAGFVNSLFVMQLILYVESAFSIAVENEDMDIANFCSVVALTRFVLAKQVVEEAA